MRGRHTGIALLAITAVVASFVVSCGGGLRESEDSYAGKPLQKVVGMFAVQTKNGDVSMRIEAPVMEHYETDSLSTDKFPNGVSVYSYAQDGLLESIIIADDAKHTTEKINKKEEVWSAFGNVVIHNILKQETMETDTIYWDQGKKEIWTDCYVKMYSPDGFMQGYGMRSDDRARNAILHKPFNGYGVVVRDTTAVVIDSVNFIGPFPKKITKFAALYQKTE